MANRFDTTLAQILVDGRYGEGTFDHPERLVKNPDADPKDWERTGPKFVFTKDNVKDFNSDDLAEMLNYVADLRAQWRISNAKAQIAAKGRESAVKMIDKIVLAAVDAFNNKHDDTALVAVLDSMGKAEVLRTLTKNRVLAPKHPLLTK